MSMHDIIKTVRIQRTLFTDLPTNEKELLERALLVRNNAQSPYSNYMVGAAVLSAKDTIHVGCNVERCSYSQTTHAEQSAIDSMIATLGPIKIEKIAIVGATRDTDVSLLNTMTTLKNNVCGHCLQIIWENSFQDIHVRLLMLEAHGVVAHTTIGDLFPFGFGPGNLNIFY